MTISTKFELQFLDGGQAFKHVTTNEALLRLETLSQLTVKASVTSPAATASNGDVFFIGEGASGDFAAHVNSFAIFFDGNYSYLPVKTGWRGYFLDTNRLQIFDGINWQIVGGGNAYFEFLHDISLDGLVTEIAFPAHSSAIGVTARVEEALTGTGINSWSLGVSGALDRYGNGLWLGQNGWVRGLTGTPMTYWSDTSLVITPDAGDITGGKIRFYVYRKELQIPPEV